VRVDTYATVERCVGMHVSKLQRCCHHMLCFEVGDCFDALVQVHVASAEVRVRLALPRPVAHLLLCNRQALSVVLDGLAEVPLRPIRIPEVPVRLALSRPVAHLLCNRQALRLAARSCAATPRQSAAPASCFSILTTRIWSAVGFAAC